MAKFSLKLNSETYRDKVYACWVGKNIGGTLGGPYEGKREVLDIKGFATAPGTPLPNDDLDLQLVWLLAVEKLGAKAINAATLGEFWLSYIVPHWNEYGICKANMIKGLPAPLSGDYHNYWKDSNGAWIRTEIWACLAPGCPDLAAKYAIEDGKVDHGAGEGTLAAAFLAAMQSAAFVVKDVRTCIDIALKKIPKNSRMADSVRTVISCYEEGKTAAETRDIILEKNMDIGTGWFEAPSNVAYSIIGLVFGEGDFKKSMLTAINCGDDTDCTAATVGATLGILGGTEVIPEDWKQYIGDDIITISINRGSVGRSHPKTCTELAERVIRQTPHFLFANNAGVYLTADESSIPENIVDLFMNNDEYAGILAGIVPNMLSFESAFLSADVTYESEPDIAPLGEKRITIRFKNNADIFDHAAYNLVLRWWLPEGFTVENCPKSLYIPAYPTKKYPNGGLLDITIRAGETVESVNRCVLEVTAVGRSASMYIPIILVG